MINKTKKSTCSCQLRLYQTLINKFKKRQIIAIASNIDQIKLISNYFIPWLKTFKYLVNNYLVIALKLFGSNQQETTREHELNLCVNYCHRLSKGGAWCLFLRSITSTTGVKKKLQSCKKSQVKITQTACRGGQRSSGFHSNQSLQQLDSLISAPSYRELIIEFRWRNVGTQFEMDEVRSEKALQTEISQQCVQVLFAVSQSNIKVPIRMQSDLKMNTYWNG